MQSLRNVTLLFPSTTELADFLFRYKVRGAEINSAQKSLKAILTEDEIVVACTGYKAELKPPVPVWD